MGLEIRTIDKKNYNDALNLRVSKNQEGFIETVKECLDESKEFSVWRPVAIYNDNVMVGFAMYGLLDSSYDEYFKKGMEQAWLDRFLIDENYQGRGYGREGLSLLIKRMYNEYSCNEIFLSIYKENEQAFKMYEKIGFSLNGYFDTKGEEIMVLRENDIKNVLGK